MAIMDLFVILAVFYLGMKGLRVVMQDVKNHIANTIREEIKNK